jgi:hypothetical protein
MYKHEWMSKAYSTNDMMVHFSALHAGCFGMILLMKGSACSEAGDSFVRKCVFFQIIFSTGESMPYDPRFDSWGQG